MTTLSPTHNDFSDLFTDHRADLLLKELNTLYLQRIHKLGLNQVNIITHYSNNSVMDTLTFNDLGLLADEYKATEALIQLFNTLFSDQKVTLVRGEHEPEYFPTDPNNFARITFAHGFFASALHEISHWCLAGKSRRQLSDFGYWYAADGRTEAQQRAFERVEVKPQALECLFTLACQRPFRVSQDNLFADFDTSTSTFAYDVYQQAEDYIANPQKIPTDAQTLLRAILSKSLL